jgi:DNA-binding beta-propeller fold protein YncE
MRTGIYLAVALCILLQSCATPVPVFSTETTEVLVNSGHQGPVNAVAYDRERRLVFTAGIDGKVKIWSANRSQPVATLQVSHLQLQEMAVNPADSQVAVLETDSIGRFRLSVWDWEERREVFAEELEEPPLYFTYSPEGRYLVYTQADWRSLRILTGRTGRSLPYLSQGFGIVSFAVVSGNEQTIMTYSPSGDIYYWDIRTGAQRKYVQTLPDLEHMVIPEDNTLYAMAASEDELVVVNLLTGDVAARTYVPGIQSIDVDPSGRTIACISSEDDTRQINFLTFQDSSLLLSNSSPIAYPGTPMDLAYARNTVLVADAEGGVRYLYTFSRSPYVFAENVIQQVHDIGFHEDTLLISASNGLFTFRSEFFESDRFPSRPVSIVHQRAPVLLEPPVMIAGRDPQAPILWSTQGVGPAFATYDPDEGAMEGVHTGTDAPLLLLKSSSDMVVTVNRNGRAQLLDPELFTTAFEYRALGMLSAAYLPPDGFVAGKNRTSRFLSSLVYINTDTGETIPVADESVVVYQLAYDERGQELYSVGVEAEEDGSLRTALRQRSEGNLDRSRLLLSREGEDLTASFAVDPDTGYVYTTVGHESIVLLSGQRTREFTITDHVPRKLYVHRNFLYSLNRDSSITVFQKYSGQRLMDIYLFQNDGWAAIVHGTGEYVSERADSYLTVVRRNDASSSYR